MNPDLNTLLHYLQSENLPERQRAAIELSRMKDEALIAPLMAALNDPDSTVRANAAAGLGTNEAKEAFQLLVALLRDKDDIVRERAATALAQIGDNRAIDPLIDALDDSGTWARNRIIYVLGASKAPQAVEPLIELLNHETPSTQGVAAWSLGAIGDSRACEPLLGLLRDENAAVRGNAAYALGELGIESAIQPLIAMLGDKSPEVRGKTAWALGNLSESTGNRESLQALIALLDDYAEIANESAHLFVCQYAAESLMQLKMPEAEAAVEAWKPKAREILQPRRIADLIRALQHKDLETRERVMQQLAELGTAALEPLIEAVTKAEQIRIRQGAAQALGLIKDSRVAHALVMALADPDSGVWSQATASLAKLGKSAEKALRPALGSSKESVSRGAAIALWRISKEEKAFKTLLNSIQDKDVVIRGSAITSLWMQPDERAVATLQIQLMKEEAGGMMAKYILQALETIGGSMAVATIANYLAEHRDKLRTQG